MADFGGEMRFTYDGKALVLRASFKSEPVPFETDGGANQDNSIFRTFKPTGYVFEPKFQDTDVGTDVKLDWEAIMRGGPYNCTLTESQTGKLYTWTGAQFEGKPSRDHHTGEIDGIKLRCPASGFSRRKI